MNTTFQTTKERRERFRTVQPIHLVNFPFEVRLERLKLIGVFQGERINRKAFLSLEHFDSISFVTWSVNEQTNDRFIHAIGHRSKENSVKFLILKYENATK